jgi:hypothetical protein
MHAASFLISFFYIILNQHYSYVLFKKKTPKSLTTLPEAGSILIENAIDTTKMIVK